MVQVGLLTTSFVEPMSCETERAKFESYPEVLQRFHLSVMFSLQAVLLLLVF